MFEIDRFSRKPIYEQLIEGFENSVICGEFKEGDIMPSVRTLSQMLSVNPNTLQKAFQELERRGICKSSTGSGRYIVKGAVANVLNVRSSMLNEIERISYELKSSGIREELVHEAVRRAYRNDADEGANKEERKNSKG